MVVTVPVGTARAALRALGPQERSGLHSHAGALIFIHTSSRARNVELLQPGGLPAKSLRVERSDTPG